MLRYRYLLHLMLPPVRSMDLHVPDAITGHTSHSLFRSRNHKEKEPSSRVEFFNVHIILQSHSASRKVLPAVTDQLLLPLSNAVPFHDNHESHIRYP
jgi:hypothetical protein